ncbi:transcription termination/antitermination protein NusG [Silvibacterium acidisoli]|uniref:transcription termination/antitermination protein NusG n=1 Tax=Acidobacteriaceae bacterium ZG23-2 TaxID=2883246 RepID=UPI00406C0819
MAVACPKNDIGLSGMIETPRTEPIYPWFALQIRQRDLYRCETSLTSKSYEIFSPKTMEVHRWADRKKRVEVPLFPGYIFCRLNPENRLPVLQVPGVLGIVSSGKTLLEVDTAEIEAIRIAVASKAHMESIPRLVIGNKVRLKTGPLAGLEGILERIQNQTRLILSVAMLNRSVSVEVQYDDIVIQRNPA